MNTKLVIAALFIPLMSTQAIANESKIDSYEKVDEEAVGLGIGSVVGGIFAGPIGVMAGAAAGALVGNSIGSDKEVRVLTSDLTHSKVTIDTLHKNNADQLQALNDAKNKIENLLAQNQELKLNTLEFAVQFRTDSSDIENHYQQQLTRLAEILTQVPEVEIDVSGFADRMGDEPYNMKLSGKRAAAVKNFLIQQGIEEKRIAAHAYGESKPIKPSESLENNFFDRRVSIRFQNSQDDSELSVAAN